MFTNAEGGVISSDSRAFNIDGTGLTLDNAGEILGTGDQRNGTVYSDGTATEFAVTNSGTIDAGEGNNGSGFAAEIGADGNTFSLDNSGDIIGRGAVGDTDGLRVGNGGDIGTATVDITNSGTISSEGAAGTTAGLRFVNGISFDGTIENSGTISGVQNGVYFGNAVDGEGADHSNGVFTNAEGGVISSDSRAFNIDGTGLTLNNAGEILGTGDQRNGTIYADGTATGFTVNNLAGGLVDGGAGNESSAISIQVGTADGDIQAASINNQGILQGRGTGVSAGIRLFNGAATGDVTFDGDITNSGDIFAEDSAGILIQSGVNLDGVITNTGNISATGGTAVDFSENGLGVSLDQNGGAITGDILLGAGDDVVTVTGGSIDGDIIGQGSGVVNIDLGAGSAFISNNVLNVEDYNILSGTVNQVGDFSTFGATTTVASGATLAFDSVVNGSGAFVSNGTLDFGPEGRLIQDGDVTLNDGSIVEFVLETPIAIGDQVELIDATTITDNGVTIIDNSVLLNLEASVDVANGDLIVETVAADAADIIDEFDGNTGAIAVAVSSALAAGDPSVIGNASQLNIAGVEDFDLLAPSVSGAATLGAYQLNDANLKLVRNQYASGNARPTELKHGLWIHGLDGSSEQDDQNGIAGFDSDFDGFGVGYSAQINDVRIGLSYNVSDAEISNNQIGIIDTDIDSDQIVLFTDYQAGDWFFGGALSYADLEYDFNRASSLEGLSPVSASTNGSLLEGSFNLGYNLKGALAGFTPIASISYSTLEIDSFNESGGLSLNNVSYDDVDRLRSELGVLFNGYSKAGNWTISPSVKLSWKHDFEDDETAFSADVGGVTFNQIGNELESDVINAGVGVSFKNDTGWNVRLDYQGEFASDEDSQFGSASLEYRF